MEIKATNFIVEPEDVSGDKLILRHGEVHHLTGVMRAGQGDIFYAIDGKGRRYCSVITKFDRDVVSADIVSITRNDNEPLMEIALGIPMLKSSAMDYALEKATECGVNCFNPYFCANTLVQPSDEESIDRKRNRWQKIIRSAVKQSLRSRIPAIIDPCSFEELLLASGKYPQKILADPGSASISLYDFNIGEYDSKLFLLIGPESGFPPEELNTAVAAGFTKIRFGLRRLRAETAAAVFPMLLQYAARELL